MFALHTTKGRLTPPAAMQLAWWCAPVIWLVATATGFWGLEQYKNAPGSIGATPLQMTDGTNDLFATGRPRLMMFMHPKCPCSVASLNELARVLEQSPPTVTAEVVFVKPPGVKEGWEQTSLWKAAASIPRVRVVCDADGTMARRLGALTSGHVVLYGVDGGLLFSGGITRSRGHEGESQGSASLIELLNGAAVSETRTPVYGCPLFSPDKCVESNNLCPIEATGNVR